MKFAIMAALAILIGVCLTASAEAQEVQCLACKSSPDTFNSYCQTYNGSWPNCTTLCDGYYCSCQRYSGARCFRGGDGTWYGYRVQDVFYLPMDRPFHTAYRVTRARMTYRPA